MQKRESKLRYLPFLFLLVVAFASVFWWSKNRRFPYHGIWQGHRTIVEFTEGGGCDIGGLQREKRRPMPTCSYYMKGNDAIVTMRYSAENWGRVTADTVSIERVSPVNDGQVLHTESVSFIAWNKKTGKRISEHWGKTKFDPIIVYKVR